MVWWMWWLFCSLHPVAATEHVWLLRDATLMDVVLIEGFAVRLTVEKSKE